MKITSATYDQFGSIIVTVEGQPPDTVITVPPDPANKDFQALMEWEAAGNTITSYEPSSVDD